MFFFVGAHVGFAARQRGLLPGESVAMDLLGGGGQEREPHPHQGENDGSK